MARPKKIKEKPTTGTKTVTEVVNVAEVAPVEVIPKLVITPLSIDYPHEYLNDMGKKINQIIEHINKHG